MTYLKSAYGRLATLLAGLAIAVMVTSLSVAPAGAAEPMTEREAGKFYLAKACQKQVAYSRFVDKIWHGRRWIHDKEVQRRLDQVTYETDRYGRAVLTHATKLLNPPAPWPATIERLPEKYASALLKEGALLRKAGSANSGSQWGYYVRKAWRVDLGHFNARIRATLDLPPSGEGC